MATTMRRERRALVTRNEKPYMPYSGQGQESMWTHTCIVIPPLLETFARGMYESLLAGVNFEVVPTR